MRRRARRCAAPSDPTPSGLTLSSPAQPGVSKGPAAAGASVRVASSTSSPDPSARGLRPLLRVRPKDASGASPRFPARRLAGAVLAAGLVAIAAPAGAIEAEIAVLQGLDKITARTSTFEIPVESTATFGALEITVHHCATTPPEQPPENKAFLEIVDLRPADEPKRVFMGWMFSSSPALNALEHPVYDVWVEDCRMKGAAPAEDAAADGGPPTPAQPPPFRD